MIITELNADWDEGFLAGLNDRREGKPDLSLLPRPPFGSQADYLDGYAAGYRFDGYTEAKEGLRLQGKDGVVVLTPKKTEDGEFVVRVMVNGKNDEAKAYYTNDWDDAVSTAKSMAEAIDGFAFVECDQIHEDANFTYVWGVFKDEKGNFYANTYYSENVYPSMVQGNMTQAEAEAMAAKMNGAK